MTAPKRLWAALTLCCALGTVKAARVIPISDLSPNFYGAVTLTGREDEVFKAGYIRVYNRKTRQKIVEIKSDELTLDVQDGKVKTNVKELSYGEQSLLIYEDFNFDGRKDLALMDGQNSCYHGPSFQIFLAQGETFKLNPALTRLAQDYCGMFEVDY